jgi:hypothetical protein
MKQLPGYQLLSERYNLSPEFPTGLSFKTRFNSRCKVNAQAGAYDPVSKRAYLSINGTNFKCSRIVYYLATGIDPGVYEVDHIDQDSANNCITNLRLATRSQNASNMKRRPNNTTGFKGVSWHKARNLFRITISINQKAKHLAHHICPARLAYTYNQAAIKEQGEFAVLNVLPKLNCQTAGLGFST